MLDGCNDSRAAADAGFPYLTEGKPVRNSNLIGCDRLSVSFPVDGFNPDRTAWSSITMMGPGTDSEAEKRQGKVVVNDVDCMVGIQFIPATRAWWGKVEFNPSRVLEPTGWGVSSLNDALDVLETVVGVAATELAAPGVRGIEDINVKRVDLTKDFQCERPDFYLRGLGPVKRPWARRNLVHYDPSRNGAQTLMVGSGAGVVRLYDKYAETEGAAPEGTLRWEAECRTGWASNYGGINKVSDLRDPDRAGQLAENRWEWSAMGVEVAARSRVIEKVQRSGLSPAKQRGFLGWLMMAAEGITTPMGKETSAEYSRLCRQLGVTLGTDVVEASSGFVGRLDWNTGREVLHAA